MSIRSTDYISGGISTFGTEYVRRGDAVVAVCRVAHASDGAGWLCRDADGKGPLRRYMTAQLSRDASDLATSDAASSAARVRS